MAIIGIMDSGVGGLSVFREIHALLPCAHYLYYADNAHCPYGEKSPEFIRERLRFITRFFLERGAQAMVLACNTATSAAIASLRNEFSIPFIGMEPAVKPAARLSRSGVIGVLATAGTLQGGKYRDVKANFAEGVQVIERVGQGFVELVEGDILNGPVAEQTVRASLAPLLDAGADAVVLGCTHYPFLLETLRKVASDLGKPDTVFIDPAPAVARRLQQVLQEHGIAGEDPCPATEFFSSGPGEALRRMAGLIA